MANAGELHWSRWQYEESLRIYQNHVKRREEARPCAELVRGQESASRTRYIRHRKNAEALKRQAEQRRIDKANRLLQEKIAKISSPHKAERGARLAQPRHARRREDPIKAQELLVSNISLLRRIVSAKPFATRQEWARDRTEMERYLNRLERTRLERKAIIASRSLAGATSLPPASPGPHGGSPRSPRSPGLVGSSRSPRSPRSPSDVASRSARHEDSSVNVAPVLAAPVSRRPSAAAPSPRHQKLQQAIVTVDRVTPSPSECPVRALEDLQIELSSRNLAVADDIFGENPPQPTEMEQVKAELARLEQEFKNAFRNAKAAGSSRHAPEPLRADLTRDLPPAERLFEPAGPRPTAPAHGTRRGPTRPKLPPGAPRNPSRPRRAPGPSSRMAPSTARTKGGMSHTTQPESRTRKTAPQKPHANRNKKAATVVEEEATPVASADSATGDVTAAAIDLGPEATEVDSSQYCDGTRKSIPGQGNTSEDIAAASDPAAGTPSESIGEGKADKTPREVSVATELSSDVEQPTATEASDETAVMPGARPVNKRPVHRPTPFPDRSLSSSTATASLMHLPSVGETVTPAALAELAGAVAAASVEAALDRFSTSGISRP